MKFPPRPLPPPPTPRQFINPTDDRVRRPTPRYIYIYIYKRRGVGRIASNYSSRCYRYCRTDPCKSRSRTWHFQESRPHNFVHWSCWIHVTGRVVIVFSFRTRRGKLGSIGVHCPLPSPIGAIINRAWFGDIRRAIEFERLGGEKVYREGGGRGRGKVRLYNSITGIVAPRQFTVNGRRRTPALYAIRLIGDFSNP